MQKHERRKKRLRLSLEIRRRYSISHHVVAISPRWLNTNLRPKNCNPTAVATLLFSSAKFWSYQISYASLLLPYPLIVSCDTSPPLFHLGLLQDQQKNISPYHERMHGFIHSGIKEKLEMLPSIPHFLPFEGMLPQVCSPAALSPSWFLGLPHQIPKSHGFI